MPIDPARLNVNGGAIALGHPLGCTGARLTASMVHEMGRRGARYGLVTLCIGGGMGASALFERWN
jgi:acetyl-CoA acyltransferase